MHPSHDLMKSVGEHIHKDLGILVEVIKDSDGISMFAIIEGIYHTHGHVFRDKVMTPDPPNPMRRVTQDDIDAAKTQVSMNIAAQLLNIHEG